MCILYFIFEIHFGNVFCICIWNTFWCICILVFKPKIQNTFWCRKYVMYCVTEQAPCQLSTWVDFCLRPNTDNFKVICVHVHTRIYSMVPIVYIQWRCKLLQLWLWHVLMYQCQWHTVQAAQYMEDQSRDLQSLKRYPVVMDMFLRYNTVIPSSAAVERLFSAGGQIMIPRRNGLSDGSVEKLLLLRQNNLA